MYIGEEDKRLATPMKLKEALARRHFLINESLTRTINKINKVYERDRRDPAKSGSTLWGDPKDELMHMIHEYNLPNLEIERKHIAKVMVY